MPYALTKSKGGKYKVRNRKTGKTYSKHWQSRAQALKQLAALQIHAPDSHNRILVFYEKPEGKDQGEENLDEQKEARKHSNPHIIQHNQVSICNDPENEWRAERGFFKVGQDMWRKETVRKGVIRISKWNRDDMSTSDHFHVDSKGFPLNAGSHDFYKDSKVQHPYDRETKLASKLGWNPTFLSDWRQAIRKGKGVQERAPEMHSKTEGDCGTGAGGFKKGNKCQKGKGKPPAEPPTEHAMLKSMSDKLKRANELRYEHGHRKFDSYKPLDNPVHSALKKMHDEGLIEHHKAWAGDSGHFGLTKKGHERLAEHEKKASEEKPKEEEKKE